METRKAVRLNGFPNGTALVEQIEVDATPMSPFTHEALGGTPTIMGSWSEDHIVLLGLAAEEQRGAEIPSSALRSDCRDPGNLCGPLLLVRIDGEDVLDLDVEGYEAWLAR